MPTISETTSISPSGGTSRARVTDSSPWTSMTGLKVPILAITPPPPKPRTTGMVGRARWVTSWLFSVVNSSSDSGSSAPAPTPIA